MCKNCLKDAGGFYFLEDTIPKNSRHETDIRSSFMPAVFKIVSGLSQFFCQRNHLRIQRLYGFQVTVFQFGQVGG